jgi:pimeloyl-ACP methyl ester carboxylesterase
MAMANVNGVRLFYEVNGTGAVPLVLVHGSWDSHHDWDPIVPRLADLFRVVTYDRRGHSASERPPGPGSVREDVDDLAGLIEHLGLAPTWVIGNSFGASITLRLAGTHPELLRGLIGHEPPLFSLLADDPALAPMLEDVMQRIGAVVERIATGRPYRCRRTVRGDRGVRAGDVGSVAARAAADIYRECSDVPRRGP